MTKVAIVGGAGFIGSAIVDELIGHNIKDITVIDDFSTGRRDNLPQSSVSIVERGISGLGDFFKLNKFDWVINCAAQVSTFESVTNPEKDFRINAEGIFYLLESLRKADYKGGFIYTSSRSIYGNIPSGAADEETPYKPSTMYNTNKYYGENLTKLYAKLYGLNTWILRPSNVFGPRQPPVGQYNFVCRWIAWALQGKPIPIWGDGTQSRDFVYVKKIANAYWRIIDQQPQTARTFLLASGTETTLKDLAYSILAKITKDGVSGIEWKPAKAGDIQRFVGNSDLAYDILGWDNNLVGLNIGLDDTIKWVSENIDRYGDYNL